MAIGPRRKDIVNLMLQKNTYPRIQEEKGGPGMLREGDVKGRGKKLN